MANMCENQIYIVGPVSEITTLFEKINECIGGDDYYEEFERICIEAGFSRINDDGKIESTLPCTGAFLVDPQIIQVDEETSEIYMETDTKWEPQSEMWLELLKKYAPNSKYYHLSIEPGCGIYETNDINRDYFDIDYIVDYYNISDELDEIFDECIEDGLNYFSEDDYIDEILDILEYNIINKADLLNNESLINGAKEIAKDDKIKEDADLLTEKFVKLLKDHLYLNDDNDIGFSINKVEFITYDE